MDLEQIMLSQQYLIDRWQQYTFELEQLWSFLHGTLGYDEAQCNDLICGNKSYINSFTFERLVK
jgi:hypothetical protein